LFAVTIGEQSLRLLCLFFSLLFATSAQYAPTGYDIERYDVPLTPDFETKSITGSTRFTLQALRDSGDSIEVSHNALSITHISSGTIEPAAKGLRRIELPRP
jgi:aminopeptidase N